MPSPLNMQPVTYLRSEGQAFRFERDTWQLYLLSATGAEREITDSDMLTSILFGSVIISEEEATGLTMIT